LPEGHDGFGGNKTTLLADGLYNLLLDTDLISALANASVALKDDDGVNDGVYGFGFHRLKGDFDGSRDVTYLDPPL
jgi:hypothetical protein